MTTIVKKRQKGDKSEVRKRILDKASEAFKVHGIKSVHMDDLAVSLGISKRTIYELFHDRIIFHYYKCTEISKYLQALEGLIISLFTLLKFIVSSLKSIVSVVK